MSMHSTNMQAFDPKRAALLSDVMSQDSVKELLHSDELDDFVTVLNLLNPKQALAFADCIFKCRRHGLKEREKRYWLKAKALCAVGGRRAELYAQTLAKVFVAEYFGGKSHGSNGNKPDDGNK